MATKNKVLIDGVQLGTSLSEVFSGGAGVLTRIIAFSVTNDAATPTTFDLHIVPSGDTADASNRIIKERSVLSGDSEVVIEVLNQLVPSSGSIEMKASAATAISVRASGIEFT